MNVDIGAMIPDINEMLRVCSLIVLFLAALPVSAGPQGIIRVIDGDTFDVGGTMVRLHAVDAPEGRQFCGGDGTPTWSCGAWVTRSVRTLFEGRLANCVGRDTDRYGRLVATCIVDGDDLGATLVSDGLAFAYRKYGWDYDLQEKAAVVAGRGLHAGSVQEPGAFRQAGRKTRAAPTPDQRSKGCVIKGNIASSQERIYHLPGQNWYAVTYISGSRGERWFCSEAEAQSAGWRRAKR